MTTQYGAQTLPAPVEPSLPEILDPQVVRITEPPWHDPLLYYLGTFLTAVANAEVGDAWRALSPGDEAPVRALFFNDPAKFGLNTDTDLPGFFLWRRKGGKPRQLADGWRVRDTTLNLVWIVAPAQPEHERARQTAVHAVFAAIDTYLPLQRHPAWVVPGDTHPQVYAEGTALPGVGSWLGALRDADGKALPASASSQTNRLFMHCFTGEWERADVAVEMLENEPGMKPPTFEAYTQTFELRERLTINPLSRSARLQGLTQTIQTHPTDSLGPFVAQQFKGT